MTREALFRSKSDGNDASARHGVLQLQRIVREVGERSESPTHVRRAHAGECLALGFEGREVIRHAQQRHRDGGVVEQLPEGLAAQEPLYASAPQREPVRSNVERMSGRHDLGHG